MKYSEQLKHLNWQKKRLEILKRDKYTCQFCKGKDISLEIHHLIYLSGHLAWEYDNELLISLCSDCHDEIHELNKVIALISKNVIINKIDLIELSEIIKTFAINKQK